ncbi:hypothetical protein KR51_00016880 [Rubidibacter lacunae KORDI 51-2]|uniref:Uncharacterized protein n=1 Tax=Rubidibacter lacunae KORDI 51-2 TaxID=582515 RepID=U5DPS1_9CHRO|nr:hypothetical protein [Rubidibacter lacunae]ERN41695.1 hypothetical protein KR51_00016880 [Rubidibacter lacunae KORDI 51-2]
MNVKIVEAIAQLVQTLSNEERNLLEAKLHQANDRDVPNANARTRSVLDLAKPWVGCINDGPEDLAANEAYMEGYDAR